MGAAGVLLIVVVVIVIVVIAAAAAAAAAATTLGVGIAMRNCICEFEITMGRGARALFLKRGWQALALTTEKNKKNKERPTTQTKHKKHNCFVASDSFGILAT